MHAYVGNRGHWFQIWGQIKPPRLFGGCIGLRNPAKIIINHQKIKFSISPMSAAGLLGLNLVSNEATFPVSILPGYPLKSIYPNGRINGGVPEWTLRWVWCRPRRVRWGSRWWTTSSGGNCIKIGLPRKSILGDYFQENRTSRGMLHKIVRFEAYLPLIQGRRVVTKFHTYPV